MNDARNRDSRYSIGRKLATRNARYPYVTNSQFQNAIIYSPSTGRIHPRLYLRRKLCINNPSTKLVSLQTNQTNVPLTEWYSTRDYLRKFATIM
jgi:hypothetical protein